MHLMDCATTLNKPNSSFNLANFIASLGGIFVSGLVIYLGYRYNKKALAASEANTKATLITSSANNDKTIASKRIEERKNEIYKKLNEFYQPLFQYRQKSTLLYFKFKEVFEQSFIATATQHRFRTLNYLLDGGEINGNEKALLVQIIRIGKLTENLIHEKAGLIDDDDLRKIWLPKLTTHLLILRLAYKGELKGETIKFEEHTFPAGIDDLIEKRIKALQEELKSLG